MGQVGLARYPFQLALGLRTLVIRPLKRGDERELGRFFRTLSAEERAILKDDVTNPAVIAAWCSNIDHERVVPLVALDGDRIVGDATLHRSRTGWTRHVASTRVTVDPEYRRKGLGCALIRELMALAAQLELAVLDAEIMAEQKSAIALFVELGFRPVATLPLHVADLNNQLHDLLILSKTIAPVERLSPAAAGPGPGRS